MPNQSVFDLKLKSQERQGSNPWDLQNILDRKAQGSQYEKKPTTDLNPAANTSLDIIAQAGGAQNQFVNQQVAKAQEKKQNDAFSLAERGYQSALANQQQQSTNFAASQVAGPTRVSGGANLGTPTGDPNTVRGRLVNSAASFAGTPYVWGGTSTKGFDCSGLLQYVYKGMGIALPRVSQQQATQGKQVTIDKLKPGDLVAWGSSPSTSTHIAIYAGNGKVWEAARKGTNVRTRAISASERGIMGIALNI